MGSQQEGSGGGGWGGGAYSALQEVRTAAVACVDGGYQQMAFHGMVLHSSDALHCSTTGTALAIHASCDFEAYLKSMHFAKNT